MSSDLVDLDQFVSEVLLLVHASIEKVGDIASASVTPECHGPSVTDRFFVLAICIQKARQHSIASIPLHLLHTDQFQRLHRPTPPPPPTPVDTQARAQQHTHTHIQIRHSPWKSLRVVLVWEDLPTVC